MSIATSPMEAGELEEARKETESRVLERNRPLREAIIDELKAVLEQPQDKGLEKVSQLEERWIDLGLVLDDEADLKASYESLSVQARESAEKQNAQEDQRNDKRNEIFSRLEVIAKQEAVSDKEPYEECLRMWIHLEEESAATDDELKRFKRLTEKIQVLLKRGDHHIKVEKLENLCRDLTALKHKTDIKVSEKNKEIKRIKDEFKAVDLHTGNKVQKLREKFATLVSQVQQELGWERWSNSKRKEDLVKKAEDLLQREDVKDLGEALKAVQKKWKEIGYTSKADDEVWEKFKATCDQVYQKFQSQLEGNETEKKSLLEKAEAAKDSDAWRKTSNVFKDLQDAWKKVGPVPMKSQWKLERQFRKACGHFFDRRRVHFEKMDGEQKENLKKKEVILANVEKLVKEPNWKSIFSKVKDAQAEWKKIGPVPKEQSDDIWNKFRAACDVVYEKKKAEDNVNYEEEMKNFEAKEALLVKMNEALEQSDLVQIKNDLQSLDKEWKEIGDVPRNKKRSLDMKNRDVWQALSKKEKAAQAEKDKVQEENALKKVELLYVLEDLILTESWADAADAKQNVSESWDQVGAAKDDRDLKKRYRKAIDILSKDPVADQLKSIRKESEKNSEQYALLCLKIENLAGFEPVFESEEIRRQWMVSELQAKMGKKNAFKNKKEEAAHLYQETLAIAFVEKTAREQLKARIQKALEKLNG